jgi:hypothetical protein
MAQIKIQFQLDRETAGALKYSEVLPNGTLAPYPNSPGAKVGTLYVRKSAMNGGTYPQKLSVTIDTE